MDHEILAPDSDTEENHEQRKANVKFFKDKVLSGESISIFTAMLRGPFDINPYNRSKHTVSCTPASSTQESGVSRTKRKWRRREQDDAKISTYFAVGKEIRASTSKRTKLETLEADFSALQHIPAPTSNSVAGTISQPTLHESLDCPSSSLLPSFHFQKKVRLKGEESEDRTETASHDDDDRDASKTRKIRVAFSEDNLQTVLTESPIKAVVVPSEPFLIPTNGDCALSLSKLVQTQSGKQSVPREKSRSPWTSLVNNLALTSVHKVSSHHDSTVIPQSSPTPHPKFPLSAKTPSFVPGTSSSDPKQFKQKESVGIALILPPSPRDKVGDQDKPERTQMLNTQDELRAAQASLYEAFAQDVMPQAMLNSDTTFQGLSSPRKNDGFKTFETPHASPHEKADTLLLFTPQGKFEPDEILGEIKGYLETTRWDLMEEASKAFRNSLAEDNYQYHHGQQEEDDNLSTLSS
ncbi:hypothetical protein NEOLI_001889 [Neolecta irregularis DAH-3]|uniref:Uncharacterized protein n=1 Tax=Neolecta irregularis (strain DAH-3) TaxID=1198029 RepID=A0A1U7LW04_NEOID|nr:hypothetical protein NEOLI_001889 [Neolecta irregularis DAH-3]|eukprot:OLL26860.1 hypothetical protein NEOLI_001889 [Neolecta irregularis DAH-3]